MFYFLIFFSTIVENYSYYLVTHFQRSFFYHYHNWWYTFHHSFCIIFLTLAQIILLIFYYNLNPTYFRVKISCKFKIMLNMILYFWGRFLIFWGWFCFFLGLKNLADFEFFAAAFNIILIFHSSHAISNSQDRFLKINWS